MGIFDKIKNGLAKTKENLITKIQSVIKTSPKLTDEIIDKVEEILLLGDVGAGATEKIIKIAKDNFKKGKFSSSDDFVLCVKNELENILNASSDREILDKIKAGSKPYIILIVGVNGVGKTTSIGKLSNLFVSKGLKVIIGAADTFRAAANQQLDIWAKRADVKIVINEKSNDPSSVVFDTLSNAQNEKSDVVIIDTAGRLHVKTDLMNELNKIQKVIEKKLNKLPDEVLLIIDANVGQNAVIQAREFSKYVNLTGLIVTKLDGTAKGGIIFQLSHENKIPVRFIGIGEGIEDFEFFNNQKFIGALFD